MPQQLNSLLGNRKMSVHEKSRDLCMIPIIYYQPETALSSHEDDHLYRWTAHAMFSCETYYYTESLL